MSARADSHRGPSSSRPAAAGLGPRGGSPPIAARFLGDRLVDTPVLQYAETQTREALRRFSEIRAVDILLGSRTSGETTCRLVVKFVSGMPILVAHSGPAILHAIDIAIETTAHIVSCRKR